MLFALVSAQAASSSETFTTFLVFLLPFLLLVAAGGAYLTYIRIVHPDVLKPPKKVSLAWCGLE